MKKKGIFIATVTICIGVMFSALLVVEPEAADKVINLKVASFFPPPSNQSKIIQEFSEELEMRSGGRLKVQFFGGGSMLTASSMFSGIGGGIADIGYTNVYYTPGRMPVCEGIGLPLGTPTAWVGSHMAYDFYEKFKPREFDKVRILFFSSTAPNLLISKKPVEKLEDLKGLVIRAPGLTGQIVTALGATPAPTPMPEIYDALSKGVIDGVYAPYETLKAFRIAELAKYVTVAWQIGSVYPFYLAMNGNSYNKLPHDLQSLVDTMSGQYLERFALVWNEIELTGKAFGSEKGVKYLELSEQEGARWQKAVEPVITEYIKELAKKGHSEAVVKSWISYMRDRIDYWTKRQVDYRILSPTGPAGLRLEALCK